MKNVLIVTPFMPYPLNSGGNIAQFVFIDKLRDDYNLYLLFPQNEIDDNFTKLSLIWSNVTLLPFKETFNLKVKRYISQKIPAIFEKYITIYSLNKRYYDINILYNTKMFESDKYYIDKEFVRYIEKLVTIYNIDLIQVEFYDFISLGKLLSINVEKVFIHHEIRFVRESREMKLLKPSNSRIQRLLEKNKLHEISMLSFYDKIVTLSKVDVEILQSNLPNKNILPSPIPILPNINFLHNNYSVEFSNKLVFLGGGAHFPNVDGLTWFLDNVWEMIKIDFPDVNLFIVGSWPEHKIRKFKNDSRVKFLGFVEDLSDILIGSIFIIPIRIGSGIRMKIVEAINLGCPIISTTVGIEGINLEPNTDYLLSDTPLDFLKSVKTLIGNPELYRLLINNSKNNYNRHYSFDALIKQRKNIYN
ncbi:glycosyltransferase family 4 protein [Runella slithyformis]|uniref:Glycosyl transferase group 1 n=1 Tax=Runella slithyformis (strain ATCC 29530 / DSM 19594 / LMG 11500 / NCIMB 11436 / LSU 4) TaxID=761193 RepID=A0A7U4E7U3_RUNSL|nr:glycosyltransferase family 4 protein [Runella slithyformis]AEI51011.1 glycosyl transferase group 1 [Runella slithyformis DSM 19594]